MGGVQRQHFRRRVQALLSFAKLQGLGLCGIMVVLKGVDRYFDSQNH